jgi:hypothetical protein
MALSSKIAIRNPLYNIRAERPMENITRLLIDVARKYKKQDCLKNLRRVNIIRLKTFPITSNMNMIKPIH